MQTELFTIWEASKALAHWLPFRSQKSWYGYLYRNPKDFLNQDGYKITVHTINGKRMYTKFALVAFITAHRNGYESKPKGKSHD
jgi:hypothetical protein